MSKANEHHQSEQKNGNEIDVSAQLLAANRQLQRQTQQLKLLNELAIALTHANSVADICDIALAGVERIFAGNQVTLALLDSESAEFEIFARSLTLAGTKLAKANTLLGTAVDQAHLLVLPNVANVVSEFLDAREGVRSLLVAPLIVHEQVLGTLNIGCPHPQAYSNYDEQLASQIATQVAVDLQNVRQSQQVQQQTEKLRESEERLRLMLQNLPTPVAISDTKEGKLRYLNEAFGELFDGPVEELIKFKASAYYQDLADRQMVLSAFQQNGFVKNLEARFQKLNGEPVPATISIQPFTYAGENVILSSFYDLSEQKRAEATLTKQAEELQTVAEVSTRIATTLNEQALLQDVVELTKERFGLYHAHIYLLDETGEILKLAAGAGEAGQTMIQQGWSIPLNHTHSIVALTARQQQGIIANDVRSNPDFLPNPLLPDTRSEMAIPMIVRGELLGVLDVQADVVDRFTEHDVQIKTTLASQVAVAVQNAQQYQQTQQALAEMQAVQRRYTAQAWQEYRAKAGQKGFEKVGETIAPLRETQLPPEMREAVAHKTTVLKQNDPALDQPTSARLAVPLTIRGEIIGVLSLEDPLDHEQWTADEIALVEGIAEQMAQTAENLRLFDETQERGARERTIREITDKLRAAPTLDKLLETAARELGVQLGARRMMMEVGIETKKGQDDEATYRRGAGRVEVTS